MVGVTMEPISAVKVRNDRTSIPGYFGFHVSVTTVDGAAIVRVVGDLDCYTAPQLRSALVALVSGGARQVVLDVGGTQFIDSTGLSVLVGGLKRLREHGGTMIVKSPTDSTRRLFEITGLTSVFDLA